MTFVVHLGLVSAIVLSPCLAAAGAQTPGPPPARAAGPLADSLRAFALGMAAMLRNLDAQGTIALYGDRSHFVHVENGNVIPWSELSGMMTSYFATAKRNPLSVIGEPGVTIVDESNAVVYVVHHFDANEGRPAHDGVWTGVLHRFPDGWKIVHSHSSDRRPLHETRR
jgi:hypothetical protein